MHISKQDSFAMFRLGFRPFFLLGSVSGVISLVVWLASFQGLTIILPANSLWHAHEMLFGFVMAIVVGFLLTASANWANKPGLQGVKLGILTGVWLLGRLLFLVPEVGHELRMIVDLSFQPLAIIFLYPYLKSSSNKANLAFIGLLTSLWVCNLLFHLDQIKILQGFARQSLLASIQIVIIILVVISGRVIPFFTKRAIPDYRGINIPWLNHITNVFTLAFVGTYLFVESGPLLFWLGIANAILHSARLYVWFDYKILKSPILFILYLGYSWLVVAFFASSLATRGFISSSLATHAFSASAISIMIVGMMTRVTLGHTGRKIFASKTTILTYTLIVTGSLVRFFAPLLFSEHYSSVILLAGILWSGALITFIAEYASILTRPRIDGKAG